MSSVAALGPSEIAAFRGRQSRLDLRRYEHLSQQERGAPLATKGADKLLERGWRMNGGPPVRVEEPVVWHGEEARRSWWFHLNCLDPIGPLLDAFDVTGDERYLVPAAGMAVDWCRTHPSLESANPFAWYDMAVGLRAYRLAYLLDAMARSPSFGDDEVGVLLHSVLLHADALADEDTFAWHSNHGLYQAVGQLAMAWRLPTLDPMPAARAQSLIRLEELIDTQFTEEGVHVEHSPNYHWIVLRTLRGVLASGLVDDDGLLDRVQSAEDALSWFVLPDRYLVMFGDTSQRRIDTRRATGTSGGALGFVATSDRDGIAPDSVARAFPKSGYFVVRSEGEPADGRAASYLAFNAAFHSRTHKHADDLSFVWFDRGQEILGDAGCFGFVGAVEPGSALWEDGFWYSHPSRVYVESTRAHNTVEIDGRSYQRRDKPYGSGIRRWTSSGSVHAVEASARHFGTVEHNRLLVFEPGGWVLVVDSIDDRSRRGHDIAQRFHLAPELHLVREGDQFEVPVGEGEPLTIMSLGGATSAEHVRGRGEPDLLGWVSRRIGEMTPCWSLAYRAQGGQRHMVATVLAFGGVAPLDASPPADGRERWSWLQADGAVNVEVDRSPGALRVEVTR